MTVETAAGEVVRTLARRTYPVGSPALVWNGLDRTKKAVKGGSYVVRVVAKNALGAIELSRPLRVQRIVGPKRAVGSGRPSVRRGAPMPQPPSSASRAADQLCSSILSGITDAVTTAIGNYGLYAVFLLMLIDAVFPAASEVVMVYGGAIASGAIAGTSVTLFGYTFEPGLPAYLAIALAGTIGYLIGAVIGWEIGRRGGRPYLERHGRWLHLDHAKLERAEAWFQRWEDWAVFLGRLTPVVRSFVSIPAGIFEAPLRRYTVLTLIGSAIWCFVFAGDRLGCRGELGELPPGLPLRGLRRGARRRRRRRLARLALSAQRRLPVGRRIVRASDPQRGVFPACAVMGRRRAVHSGVVIPLVDVKAQYAPLIPELKERFAEVLESGRFIFGPEVEAFERESAAYLDVPHAIGVANGTDALVLSLEAMGIGAGDEVICPSFTFYATAEAIARAGATPVFADIDPVTLNLDPADVAARITPRTKAIMPVHLFGRPAPLAELGALGLPLIEDAAQAFGAAGRREHGSLLDLQLLPDQEPVRARRRRARRLPRRRGGRARPDAALPRLARQADVRARRHQLAARRDPGRGAARLPAPPRGLERGPPRGCRALRRARPRRASSSCRSTSRATSTTCTSSARPSAPRIAAALKRGRHRVRVLLRDAAAPAARDALPRRTSRARCPRPSVRRPTTSRCRCGAASAPTCRSRSSRPCSPLRTAREHG